MVGGDPLVQHAFGHDAHRVPIGGADDVDRVVMVIEIFHEGHHRLEVGFAVGHVLKAIHGQRLELAHHLGVDFRRQPLVELRAKLTLFGVKVIDGDASEDLVLPGLREGFQLLRGLEAVVIQRPLDEKPVVEIGWKALAIERAVHVEHGDAVRLRDIPVGCLIHRVRDKLHDGLHRGGIRSPVVDQFRLLRPGFRDGECEQQRKDQCQ